MQGSNAGPVFTFCNGRLLTRDMSDFKLEKILMKLDLQICNSNMHSIRIGAETSAKQAGICDMYIMTYVYRKDGKVIPISATSEPPSTTGQPIKITTTLNIGTYIIIYNNLTNSIQALLLVSS